jgi:16S rRNA (guanine966-N2)-methyltransferase
MTLRIIAGKFKGRLLKTPKGPSTRPTQGMLRAAVFNICQNQIEGARFLDLFAGSGAMSFEALSRGASHATLVESNRIAIACIKENIIRLDVQAETTLIPSEARLALNHLSGAFDLIYLDPPYDTPTLLEEIASRNLLAPGGILFVEERFKPNKIPPASDFLIHIDSRRFGDALLHQYRFSGT